MNQLVRRWLLPVLMALALAPAAQAIEAPSTAADPALEARVLVIAAELRCLVCQNQTVADSHAGLAVDLRQEIRTMLGQGRTDAEVIAFMTQRYGDFVLYRPPVKSSTWPLWFGPAALMLIAVAALVRHLRRRAQRPDSDFEPEAEPLVDDGTHSDAPAQAHPPR